MTTCRRLIRSKMMRQTIATSSMPGMRLIFPRMLALLLAFPFDTYASIARDIERLKNEIQVDQASFFMLTPIPGSMDHLHAVQSGVPIDTDLNRYDSFHPTMDHPHMSREQWFDAYKQAWQSFYNFENMRNILQRATPRMYWNVFKNLVWYKSAAILEGNHPMMTGFFRLKGRTARRPGYAIDRRLSLSALARAGSARLPESMGALFA